MRRGPAASVADGNRETHGRQRMDEPTRMDRLEMRLTEQDATIEDLNRTVTEQWRLIDRLVRQVAALQDHVEEAAARSAPRGAEPPPPHY